MIVEILISIKQYQSCKSKNDPKLRECDCGYPNKMQHTNLMKMCASLNNMQQMRQVGIKRISKLIKIIDQ